MTSTNNKSTSKHLSYNVNSSRKAIYRIKSQDDEARSKFIIDTFVSCFEDGIRENPKAFHGRFSKMAATPFNFYRGSAVLFYQDLKVDRDPFIHQNRDAGHIFIHVSISNKTA